LFIISILDNASGRYALQIDLLTYLPSFTLTIHPTWWPGVVLSFMTPLHLVFTVTLYIKSYCASMCSCTRHDLE